MLRFLRGLGAWSFQATQRAVVVEVAPVTAKVRPVMARSNTPLLSVDRLRFLRAAADAVSVLVERSTYDFQFS
jgi:hypothetical protein